MRPVDIKTVFIDIETIPLQLSERQQAIYNTAYGEKDKPTPQGLLPEFARVACIVTIGRTPKNNIEELVYDHDDEREMLDQFISRINEVDNRVRFVGHNIKRFDLPFLCARMVIHGLVVPPVLRLSGMKPWEVPHVDTMELWGFGGFGNNKSLEVIAQALGIEAKTGMHGSDVAQAWTDGRRQEVIDYCLEDVRATVEIAKRLKQSLLFI